MRRMSTHEVSHCRDGIGRAANVPESNGIGYAAAVAASAVADAVDCQQKQRYAQQRAAWSCFPQDPIFLPNVDETGAYCGLPHNRDPLRCVTNGITYAQRQGVSSCCALYAPASWVGNGVGIRNRPEETAGRTCKNSSSSVMLPLVALSRGPPEIVADSDDEHGLFPMPFKSELPVRRNIAECSTSHIARLFQSRRHVKPGCPDEDIGSVLGEVVDDVFRTSHMKSQKHLPSVVDLQRRFQKSHRDEVLKWLVEMCEDMRYHDSILFSTILMLDQYMAKATANYPVDRKVILAVVCTSLKTSGVQDEVCSDASFRNQLLYMCHMTESIKDILSMELKVLQILEFNVSSPTVLDFLDMFSAPLTSPEEPLDSSLPRCLANFLVQLSFFNCVLHYNYPHAVLAASAIYLALCKFKAETRLYQTLLEDVTLACEFDIPDIPGMVSACARELLSVWQDFAANNGETIPCLLRKFVTVRLEYPMLLCPPVLPEKRSR